MESGDNVAVAGRPSPRPLTSATRPL